MKVKKADYGEHHSLSINCPGCKGPHAVNVGPGGWGWNGSFESPTISPSIKVSGVRGDDTTVKTLCHSFVREGRIEFLNDCAHALAGETVDLLDMNEDGL